MSASKLVAGLALALACCAASPAVALASDTTTTVSCASTTPVLGAPTDCTATVSDNDGVLVPDSTVAFTSNGQGTFSPSSRKCTLAPTAAPATASCKVSYSANFIGQQQVTASYAGSSSGDLAGSSDSQTLTAGYPPAHPTTTSVVCTPGSVAASSSTTCVIKVTDVDTTGSPSGVVQMTTDKTGAVSPENSACVLNPNGFTTSTCTILYAPTEVGEAHVDVAYAGTPSHAASTGSTQVTVTERPAGSQSPTDTAISCAPAAPAVGAGTSCVVTVTDRGESPAAPAGSVAVAASGGGTASDGGNCALASVDGATSRCVFTYVPRSSGMNTVTVRYPGSGVHAPSESSAGLMVPAPAVPVAPAPATPAKPATLGLGGVTTSARRGLARSGRFTIAVSAPGAGKIDARLLARLSKRSKTKVVGSASVRAKAKGALTLTLRLSRAARAALARDGRLVVRLEVRQGRRFRTTRFTLTRGRAASSSTTGHGR